MPMSAGTHLLPKAVVLVGGKIDKINPKKKTPVFVV